MRRIFLYTTLIVSGIFVSTTLVVAQVSLPNRAAIGLRVFTNDKGLSALDWYRDQCATKRFTKCGNPTPIIVDGYDGIRDGNTVYVGAANKNAQGELFTNIYLMSLAESVGSNGGEIFTQLLKNWKFNTNPGMSGNERDTLKRDVRRRAQLQSIHTALAAYKIKTGKYPDLAAGSYIRGVSFSTWPSWQATLGTALGGAIPEDRGGPAPDPVNPAKTTIQNFAGCASPYDAKTCWDARASKMGCPALAFAYAYRIQTDGKYKLTAGYESSTLPDSWWLHTSAPEPVPKIEEKHTSATFESAGLCIPLTCGNNRIEGSEQCDGTSRPLNTADCSAKCELTCNAGFHLEQDANGIMRTCTSNVETRTVGNRNERRTWNASTNQWAVAGWVLQSCNSGYIKQGSECVEAGAVNWKKEEPLALWPARAWFPSVVFGGKMWVLGGLSGNNVNDVWSSPDGVTWTQVTAAAPWPARWGHTAVVFDDGSGEKIWVLGGLGGGYLNDVWSSPDGVTWTQVTAAAPWPARAWHTSIVFGGKMWVLGGVYFNDVWSSLDGKNWNKEPTAPWSGRHGHTTVVFGGKMWVLGGVATVSLNDVWSSSDGKNWVLESVAPWSARRGHASVVFNGKMWVLGGYVWPGDVWSSLDGKNWTKEQAPPWPARAWFPSVVFGGKMWVFGGTGGSTGKLNDVWRTPTSAITTASSPTPIACTGASTQACSGGAGSNTDGTQTRTCDTTNGTWGSWSSCASFTCSTGNHLEGSSCVGNARACAAIVQPANSTGGTQTWSNGVWGACTGWTCSSGYQKQADQCVQVGALIWKQETNAPWPGRMLYTSAVLGGKAWVMGGYGASGSLNDVWSFDGTTWTQAPNVPWPARYGHTSVVFGGKVWVMGGNSNDYKNDVWSFDGTTWTQASNAPWPARYGHTSVVFGGKVWVMGGYAYKNLNDVWSFDGTTWTQAPNAPWPARTDPTAVVLNDGGGEKLWVMGGRGGSGVLNDVWSFDGTTWTQASNAPWPARYYYTATVFNDGSGEKLWVMGGAQALTSNDVWSFDGTTWTQAPNAPWPARRGHTAVVLGGKMWVMGGYDAGGSPLNDVWHSPQ